MRQPGPVERNPRRVLAKAVRLAERPRLNVVKTYREGSADPGYGSPLDTDDLAARVLIAVAGMIGTIDQACGNNTTTNISVGAVATYCAWTVTYRANYSTTHYEGGSFTVITDGSTAQVSGWIRSELGSGYCLTDDTGIDADVDSGNCRIKVTTKNLGGTQTFRATYTRVAL